MIRRICFYAAAIKFEDNFLWIEVDAMTCKQTFHSLYEFDCYILQYEQPLWQYHRWPMQKVLETHRDALTVWITLTLDVRLQSLIQVMIAVLIQDSVRIVWEKQRRIKSQMIVANSFYFVYLNKRNHFYLEG